MSVQQRVSRLQTGASIAPGGEEVLGPRVGKGGALLVWVGVDVGLGAAAHQRTP